MKLAYRTFGQGQPLIILHGLFGQSDNWNTLAKQFSEKGFQVFTLDLRNHGLSAHADEWDYEYMAADVKEFIEDHQLTSPILLGHSMGGKTAMYFQYLYGGIAQKVIVVDIAARSYEPHHQTVLEALNAVDFTQVHSRKEAETILNNYIEDFGTKQFLLKNIYWKDNVENALDWRFNLKVITNKYDNIGVAVPYFEDETPTLVIKGERSHYINDLDLEDYKKRFSNLKNIEIKGAAHWVHAEQPAAFFEAVCAFITAGVL